MSGRGVPTTKLAANINAYARQEAEVARRVPDPAKSGWALDAQGVSIAYHNSRTGEVTKAVDDISLKIAPGEFVTVVGLSGCGKSSFLNAIAGLVPITGGALKAGGVLVSKPGPDRAVVFQRPSLLPWRSVIDNIIYGLELQGVSRKKARERARDYIELVQLTGVEHFLPGALSGGMQQRVNLARALVCDPDILLLDEPFGALDAITRETMQEELLRIWEKTRKTVLMVTHQIDEAVLLSDRVLVFSDRPARIMQEVAINIPRPRSPEVKSSSYFAELENGIWDQIHKTARRRERP
ncbi:ABC transporter ATP-binding protein [Aureimonas fodinaquatilis]|uniref:ABC transporter ATP-binding protein n=2 Tax=Aureimonas fodinaquatilis TaxID=2565783 RepID=A0A5B0E0J6_9HYPH|nr:ABC transporter ATP-binding protein [Aureimonas fodinaquatilis]